VSAANCPSCGAPVEFAIGSSAVVVCKYCNSVVARTDRGVESHGKVAALVDTGSPLQVGAPGKYKGVGFRITGRTQLRHQAGGVWDEWYAAFDDGRWGWLAEAQGRFYVTFKVAAAAPRYEALELGGTIASIDGLTVAEIGEAELISAEGELPWTPEPAGRYAYADLTGDDRRFATIDYSEEPPVVFKGKETSLADLGITGDARPGARIATAALNCSKCGGALELRAPDQAERIWCPYCGAGHDITGGKLKYFAMLKVKTRVEPAIPLGSRGTLALDGEGDEYVIAGFMQRAVKFDIEYYWTEYLLYNRDNGYRWLVNSDDHWSFVTPLRPGEVQDAVLGGGVAPNVYYDQRTYKLFQEATAKVTYVLGEFYWRVEVGEAVDTIDYIAPPYGISKEVTRTGAQEVSYSHARYMPVGEVARAFNINDLPKPTGVGPMQPSPVSNLAGTWALMVFLLIVAAIVLAVRLPGRTVLDQTIDAAAAPQTEGMMDNARMIFSEPFELGGDGNVEISGLANLQNSWLFVDGNVVHEATGRFESFELPLEYYSGTDGGESWSEGRRRRRAFLSRQAPGRYSLALSTQWPAGATPPLLQVKVREGVFRWPYFFLAFLAISVIPGLAVIRWLSFEAQRWKDSAHSPFGNWETSEDDDEE
jgi:DNA-directed RNA polymerase subunit RPC12/RpoP